MFSFSYSPIWLNAEIPSSIGMLISIRIKSKFLFSINKSTASLPFDTIVYDMFKFSKMYFISSWFAGLSSATKMFALNVKFLEFEISDFLAFVKFFAQVSNSKSNQKLEPFPIELSTWILECKESIIWEQILSPKPVPSYCLFDSLSTWMNGLKILSILSFGIPIPESLIKNLIVAFFPTVWISEMLKSILPSSGVNLIALEIKLDKTCLILTPSVKTQDGIFSSILNLRSIFFSLALLVNNSKTWSPISLILVSFKEISKLPDSILEMSKMSLIMLNKDLAEDSIIEAYLLFLGVKSEDWERTWEKPIIEFKGVLISWLILAKNVDFALSAFCALISASFKESVLFLTFFSRSLFISQSS